jgi:hypothetical protein
MARGDKSMIRSFLHPMYELLEVTYDNVKLPKGSYRVTFVVKKTKQRKTKR